MDPLEYFSRFYYIPEIVVQHFTGGDLLKLSEMNSTWYDLIASSERFMSKIKIVLECDRELSPQDSLMLNKSSRLYQCLEIRCRHEAQTWDK